MIEVILNEVKNLLNQHREAIPHSMLNVEFVLSKAEGMLDTRNV